MVRSVPSMLAKSRWVLQLFPLAFSICTHRVEDATVMEFLMIVQLLVGTSCLSQLPPLMPGWTCWTLWGMSCSLQRWAGAGLQGAQHLSEEFRWQHSFYDGLYLTRVFSWHFSSFIHRKILYGRQGRYFCPEFDRQGSWSVWFYRPLMLSDKLEEAKMWTNTFNKHYIIHNALEEIGPLRSQYGHKRHTICLALPCIVLGERQVWKLTSKGAANSVTAIHMRYHSR